MRGVVSAGVVCIVVFLGFGYLILRSNVLHGEVTPRSLYASVEDEAGFGTVNVVPGPHVCKRTVRPREWTCGLPDSEGSGEVLYRVRVRAGSSCWDGAAGRRARPRRVSGCVYQDE
jgi:hypothetical protein